MPSITRVPDVIFLIPNVFLTLNILPCTQGLPQQVCLGYPMSFAYWAPHLSLHLPEKSHIQGAPCLKHPYYMTFYVLRTLYSVHLAPGHAGLRYGWLCLPVSCFPTLALFLFCQCLWPLCWLPWVLYPSLPQCLLNLWPFLLCLLY